MPSLIHYPFQRKDCLFRGMSRSKNKRRAKQRTAEYDKANAELLAKEAAFKQAENISDEFRGHRKGTFRR